MINQSYSLKCKVYKLLKGSVFKVSSNEGDPHKNLSGIVHCRDFIPYQVKISYNMQSQTIFLWRHFKKQPLKEMGKKIINQVLQIMNDIWFMYLATMLVNTHINLHNFLIKKKKKSYESRPRSLRQNFYDHFTKKVHRGNMSWFLVYHKNVINRNDMPYFCIVFIKAYCKKFIAIL